MAEFLPTAVQSLPVEDQTKTTWDFWYTDGTQVTSFADVRDMLAVDDLTAATIVANYPYPAAVPVDVMLGAHRVLRS